MKGDTGRPGSRILVPIRRDQRQERQGATKRGAEIEAEEY